MSQTNRLPSTVSLTVGYRLVGIGWGIRMGIGTIYGQFGNYLKAIFLPSPQGSLSKGQVTGSTRCFPNLVYDLLTLDYSQ